MQLIATIEDPAVMQGILAHPNSGSLGASTARRSRIFPDQLVALRGDKAAWKIVDAHRDWIRSVPVDRPHPRDVNTWEEYEDLLRSAAIRDA